MTWNLSERQQLTEMKLKTPTVSRAACKSQEYAELTSPPAKCYVHLSLQAVHRVNIS